MSIDIIVIAGHKRAGKDTLAELIRKHSSRKTYILHYADALKDGCAVMYGLAHEQLYGDLKETVDPRYGVTPRQILQLMGTEVMQYIMPKLLQNAGGCDAGRMHWVYRTIEKINAFDASAQPLFIIADARFVHETEEIKRVYGSRALIITIVRHSADGDSHSSELEFANIISDEFYNNNGTFSELEYFAQRIAAK